MVDTAKKILFLTDFSDVAENAFIYALSLAEQIKAEILIVHIVPILAPDDKRQVHPVMNLLNEQLESSELEEFEKEQERLQQHVFVLKKEHINLRFSFLKGAFLDVITDLVESQRIDIVVMGTSGANTIDKKLFGSNTMNIINNVEIPVMAIPSKVKFSSVRNYSTAVMLEPGEIPLVKKIAEYLSVLGYPMNCVNIVLSPSGAALAAVKKQQWMQKVDCPNVTLDIVISDDVDKGLLDYTRNNEIDLLGLLHRDLPAVKRIFSVNHSKLLLKRSPTALLIYNK